MTEDFGDTASRARRVVATIEGGRNNAPLKNEFASAPTPETYYEMTANESIEDVVKVLSERSCPVENRSAAPVVELDRITSAYGRRTYNNENMLDSQGCFNISTMENKHSIVYRMDELSGERDSTSTKSCLMKGNAKLMSRRKNTWISGSNQRLKSQEVGFRHNLISNLRNSRRRIRMKSGPESKYIDFEAQTGKRRKWMNCDGGDKFCNLRTPIEGEGGATVRVKTWKDHYQGFGTRISAMAYKIPDIAKSCKASLGEDYPWVELKSDQKPHTWAQSDTFSLMDHESYFYCPGKKAMSAAATDADVKTDLMTQAEVLGLSSETVDQVVAKVMEERNAGNSDDDEEGDEESSEEK
jgi:hypothetical protein